MKTISCRFAGVACAAIGMAFSALAAGTWELTPFESTDEYVFPEDWLPNEKSTGTVVKDGTAGNVYVGNEIAFEFAHAKDIRRIDIYTLNNGRKNLGFANVQVKYADASDYAEIPDTALAYREDVGTNGIRFSFGASDGFCAKNVIGIKLIVTAVHNGATQVVGKDVIGVPHDDTGEYKWDFNFVDSANFQRPADIITDATMTGISANETDGDIATVAERDIYYSGYEWTFDKPHDITSIGLFSNADESHRAFSVETIEIKRKGDAGYTQLPAAAFDSFDRGSNVVSCVLRPTERYVIREVVALKVSLGNKTTFWTPSYMAEVYISGRVTQKGFTTIFW